MAISNGYLFILGRMPITTEAIGMEEMSVTLFKNQALKLLDDVSRTGRELILTKRGKPVARIGPAPRGEKIVLGRLKGAMVLNEDIVAPLGEDDWEACR